MARAAYVLLRSIPLLAIAGLWLVGGGRASAFALYTVDRLDDVADASACTNAANDCSLRGAIIAANSNAGYDQVFVPAGEYELSIQGSDEDGAATGDLDISDPVRITGAGRDLTIIDANTQDRVFHVLPFITTEVTIEDMWIKGGKGGGGLLYVSGTTVTVRDVTMTEGDATASGGGAISVIAASLTLERVTAMKNTADSGAAVFIGTQSNVTIMGSTFAFNSVGFWGGAIYAYDDDVVLLVRNSAFDGNMANLDGGAFYNDIKGVASATFENVTWSGNRVTTGTGNAVYQTSESPTDFRFNTFAGNDGPSGAATIHVGEGTPRFQASIIADSSTVNCDGSGGAIGALGYNISDDASCAFSEDGDQNSVDPLLGLLDDNGGPTETILIAGTSPAVDHVTSGVCLPDDQRGRKRPIGSACDAGAVEVLNPNTVNALWGDNRCDAAVGVEDVLDVLGLASGVELPVQPQSVGCPAVGNGVFVGDWFAVTPWGDVDCDEDVDEMDALFVLRFVAEDPLDPLNPCPELGQQVQIG